MSFLFFLVSLNCLMTDSSLFVEVPLFTVSGSEILLTFFLDSMSMLFLSFVLIISSAVLLFSSSYMSADFFMRRFIWMVLLFVLSMALLITSLNMISIILGWDGLGVVSYVLVIYYQNEKSNAAGMITALTNRLGDVAILILIGLMTEIGSWNFMHLVNIEMFNSMFMISFLIIMASITKSAQMPFSAWLPAAMAAPTPVSALVHSSTLVTAGVYLLIRFSPMFHNLNMMWVLFLMASLTTIMASVSALFECDLKKIVALSTLSQLGVMVMTLSMGLSMLSFFHLLTHATFKALLFMCSGKIIHEMSDSQDIRMMGMFSKNLPVTCAFFNLANLALCGFPFLAGFYSKDLLIEEILLMDMSFTNYLLLGLMVLLSVAYSVRLSVLGLLNSPSSPALFSSSDEDKVVLGSYLILGALAMSSGVVLSWLILPSPNMISLPLFMKMSSLIMIVLGLFLGLVMGISQKQYSSIKMKEFVVNMWLLPLVSGSIPSMFGLNSFKILKSIDIGWAEFFGGKGVYMMLTSTSRILPLGTFSYILTYQLLGGLMFILLLMYIYLDSLSST
uniref:NADH-ubiquinone oxidoreductase chain 5 n=1 Tax=Bragasellus peltatus TaxID=1282048 RepID=A0A485ME14_9CRUS|nr:NADH dehydrogenase subunit 5 [Bragasellus peltatus]